MNHENYYYIGGQVVSLKEKGVHMNMEAAQDEIVHYTDYLKALNEIVNEVAEGGGN